MVEEELYDMHLLLLKKVEYHNAVECFVRRCAEERKECWQSVLRGIDRNLSMRAREMKQKHHRKLIALMRDQKPTKSSKSPQQIDNFVVNLSSVEFSKAELDLLNKGLNYAITPSRAPLADVISNIESAIQYNDYSLKAATRFGVEKCLLRTASNSNTNKRKKWDELSTVKRLKNHNVIYSRADKGNTVVVMDKAKYDTDVINMITSGPYEELIFKNGKPKDPLNIMIEEANITRQKVATLMNDEKLIRKFIVPNSKVASLYCLPKIHKSPMAMRPISSNICTPTEKMAGWLVKELSKFPVSHGKSVKNSVVLAEKIKNVEIRRGEIMVSFDVTALFPSVPINNAIESLRLHLSRHRASTNEIEAYVLIAQLCMKQNIFSFRDKFYRQTFGLSMGCKLSPILAELFMSDLEVELENEKLLPRIWYRYVDDVFAVVKERHLTRILNTLNSRHPTIKFTVEREKDEQIPFLDILITKKEDNTLKFGIYRKPTSTDRYITSDSNHFGNQKQAAFHCMAHRLVSIPMEQEQYDEEKEKIYVAADLNGYDRVFAKKIINQHERKKRRQINTTLKLDKPETKRISLPFYAKVTNPIRNTLKRYGLQVVHKSGNSLRELLCNAKDKVPPDERSGIYQINCRDCSAIYLGQSRRKFKVRLKEHRNAVENNRTCESSVAAHSNNLQHQIDWESAKVIKIVNNVSHLNAQESLHISTALNPLMNEDDAPIISPLFRLTKLKV